MLVYVALYALSHFQSVLAKSLRAIMVRIVQTIKLEDINIYLPCSGCKCFDGITQSEKLSHGTQFEEKCTR